MKRVNDLAPVPLAMVLVRVFVPFALGYFLSYLYRVMNAVIAPDLVRDVGLSAEDLGFLTSAYFLTFAAFQLPLGILLDRVGPRRTESALLVVAAAGALVSGLAESATGLILGRALIGFGVSACLMAAFKAFVMWFPTERLPLVNGCQMAAGGLGAVAATTPVEAIVAASDWRTVFFGLAVLTAIAAVVLFTVVPERRESRATRTLADEARGTLRVFSSSLFWRTAPLTVFSQATFLSIQGLWSGPWLRDVGNLSREAVAETLFMMAAAMILGFLIMGGLAERLSRLGVSPLTVAAGGMGAFITVQTLIVFQASNEVVPLWLAFGFFGTTGILPYAALSQRFPKDLSGRLNTGLNVIVFVVAFLAQWGIGAIIDLWPGGGDGGYAPVSYTAAFGFMLALQVAAFFWFLLFRRERVPQA